MEEEYSNSYEKKYYEDPRWEKAEEEAKKGQFAKANDLVNAIIKEYGYRY